jgi:hypothetical protein
MSLTRLGLTGIAAGVGFVLGSVIWAATSGMIGGVLDAAGIVIPASTYWP